MWVRYDWERAQFKGKGRGVRAETARVRRAKRRRRGRLGVARILLNRSRQ